MIERTGLTVFTARLRERILVETFLTLGTSGRTATRLIISILALRAVRCTEGITVRTRITSQTFILTGCNRVRTELTQSTSCLTRAHLILTGRALIADRQAGRISNRTGCTSGTLRLSISGLNKSSVAWNAVIATLRWLNATLQTLTTNQLTRLIGVATAITLRTRSATRQGICRTGQT